MLAVTNQTAHMLENADKRIEELASWEEVSVHLPALAPEEALEAKVARRGTGPDGRPLVRVVFRTAQGGSVHIFPVDPATALGEIVRVAAKYRTE
jgi:hypothetical protein